MSSVGFEKIQQACREEVIHCYATYVIFQKRANSLRSKLRALTFLGIFVPASVGAAFMSFGAKSNLTGIFLSVAFILGLFQLIGSIWAVTYRWEDDLSYSIESFLANLAFFERFKEIADGKINQKEIKSKYEKLEIESNIRSQADEKQGVTEKEKRYGMRAALRQLQCECAGCKQVPISMKPTSCDVCGDF